MSDSLTSASRDLSCPNGCFDLEVTARYETRDLAAMLDEIAAEDGACPDCGAAIPGGSD
jgi:hypothetical protein